MRQINFPVTMAEIIVCTPTTQNMRALRQIKELVDFSFIYDALLANYCLDNGGNAVPPIRIFKYLLLKSIYDLSDIDLVERSKYDMSFKYFLDMAPEDEVINPSSLTKFRKLRLKDMNLLDMLIANFDRALTHPDEQDLQRLQEAVCAVQM